MRAENKEKDSAVTLKDISAALGVSLTSVHRAIYGKEGISESLRNTILKKVEETGYNPNYVASSIKRKPIIIAVVLPSADKTGALYYAYFWKGYRNYLQQIQALNVEVEEYSVEDEEEQAEVLKKINDQRADRYNGVLTYSYTRSPEVIMQLRRLTSRKIPVMVLDDEIGEIDELFCIPANDKIIGRLTAEVFALMLPKEGTILVSTGRKGSKVHINTINGFKQYLKEIGSCLNVELLPYYENYSYETSYQGFHDKLSEVRDVVGAFALTSRDNKALLHALKETGMEGKIKAVGADLNPESVEYLKNGSFAAIIHKNAYEKGYLGFRVLTDYLVKHIQPPQNLSCVISMVYKNSLVFYEDII